LRNDDLLLFFDCHNLSSGPAVSYFAPPGDLPKDVETLREIGSLPIIFSGVDELSSVCEPPLSKAHTMLFESFSFAPSIIFVSVSTKTIPSPLGQNAFPALAE